MRLLIYSFIALLISNYTLAQENNFILQYAGDIGKYSAGIGKSLTKNYRISLHYGFVPPNQIQNKIETYTFKNSYSLFFYNYQKIDYILYTGVALYHVPGDKYKTQEISSIPDNYYRQSSIRAQLYIGHEFRLEETNSIYLESGVNDIWIINSINNDSIDLKDHVSLGLGYKYRF